VRAWKGPFLGLWMKTRSTYRRLTVGEINRDEIGMVNWAITTGLYGNWSSAIPSLKRAYVWSSDRQVMVATPPWYNEVRA
jgi:hypothetical protein